MLNQMTIAAFKTASSIESLDIKINPKNGKAFAVDNDGMTYKVYQFGKLNKDTGEMSSPVTPTELKRVKGWVALVEDGDLSTATIAPDNLGAQTVVTL